MGELRYFGYASFAYVISKRGYSIASHADNRITFWLNGKQSPDEYDPYQVRGKGESDCGYVVINPIDLDERFEDDKVVPPGSLKSSCVRIKRIIKSKTSNLEEIEVLHCKNPGHETIIDGGEPVRCKRNQTS